MSPTIRVSHGTYEVEWGDPERAVLTFENVKSSREGVVAEVSATSLVPSVGGLVHVARVDLLSTRSLAEFAKHVSARASGTGTDWSVLLEVAAREVIRRFRDGAPAVLLRDVEPPEDAGDLLPPLLVARMPTILFGDGGTGKSLIALAVAATLDSGHPYLGVRPAETLRVGYLDYEMDAAEHRLRLEAMAGDELPGVVYVPCSRPLADDVDRLRRIVAKHELGYLVVDSVGLACDGPPEAAEVAIRFFQGLRELGLGSLLVAHVNRSGDTDRPFGSTFWHNAARRTWYVKREAEIASESIALGLFAKKANTGPLPAPLGYRVDWSGGRIAIERTDVRDIPDLASHVPLRYRIETAVRDGALTVAEIAAELEVPVDSVKKALARHESKAFVRVTGPDGIYRWGRLHAS